MIDGRNSAPRGSGSRPWEIACSIFTLRFIPERNRLSLLRRVYGGLVEGGAIIIAEKVFANGARSHNMLRSIYYDFKRGSFSAEEILDKERSLRGQMDPWSEEQVVNTLCEAGFQPEDVQRFWQNHLFVAWWARKGAPRAPAGIVPFRQRIERPNDRGLVTNGGTVTAHLTRRDRSEIIFIQDPALNPLLAPRKRGRLITGRGASVAPGMEGPRGSAAAEWISAVPAAVC